MRLEVKNINGEATGRSVELPDDVFGITPNDHLIYLDVKRYLASQRQGTHKAKERGEIKGSTRKIKRQKGTGTARAGSLKNPLFRSGGRIFGPRPRNYDLKVNKKEKVLARKSALSYKAQEGNILVIENFSFDVPKTKEYVAVLENLGLSSKKTMLVTSAINKNVLLSLRNLPKASAMTVNKLNTYSILNANTLILTEDAAKSFSA